MIENKSKINMQLSSLIFLSLMVTSFLISFSRGAEVFINVLILNLFSFVFVFFADVLGDYTGPIGNIPNYIHYPTPRIFLKIIGWFGIIFSIIYSFLKINICQQTTSN